MSNHLVGVVFDAVIQEVCNASQVDFEESGVDQRTLEELRKGWQSKLSSVGIAHFPWDPAPQPPPPPPPQQNTPIPPPPVTVPSNAPRVSPTPESLPRQTAQNEQVSQQYTTAAQTSGIPAESTTGDARTKTDNSLPLPPMPSVNPVQTSASGVAQQRAADALRQRYGAAAAHQVHQLQTQSQAALALPGQQRFHGNQYSTPQSQDQKQAQQPQFSPQYSAQNQPSTVRSAQTDGAGESLADWKAEVARRREDAKKYGSASDHRLREYVTSRALLMEGGGLLAPLGERYSQTRTNGRKTGGKLARSTELKLSTASTMSSPPGPARYDGIDDEGPKKDDDEDAINSDLDDPDELAEDDPDNDESVGQVMLCTYDKVQRVKSKWKCTLKDGILTSGGKEYVFHKGQGEFEW
ncbi:hypothetical protein VTO42DRAFT_3937 [Malbranchea cinnamomea]